MDYSTIVFDTAPTGHTLRLLNFPNILEKGLSKLVALKGAMGGMMGQVGWEWGCGGVGRAGRVKFGFRCISRTHQDFALRHVARDQGGGWVAAKPRMRRNGLLCLHRARVRVPPPRQCVSQLPSAPAATVIHKPLYPCSITLSIFP